MSDIRGSVGGITYTANRYGSIIGRARTKPVDVNSSALERARNIFNTGAIGWKVLTQDQRDAWENYAKDTPWKNGLGQDINLTGQAMYIAQTSAYGSLYGAGSRAGYDDAPCVPGLFTTPWLEVGCCVNPTIGCIVSVTNMHPTNAMDVIVRRSPPQSPSVRYYMGPWDNAAQVILTGIAAAASDDAEFCPLCEARYFFEVRALDATDGNNMSTLTHIDAIACTDPI
jgi:hypothetical protein